MKKIIPIILLSVSLHVSAQEDKIQTAFSKSYTEESAGSYAKAIAALKEVYDANSYEISLRLGWLYYNNGQNIESVQHYNKAISLKPYSVEAMLGYVYPASALGNWDKVLDTYIAILKIDPGNATVNYRTGLIYYNRKNYAFAQKYFEKLVNLYPFSFDGVHILGWTYLKTGKKQDARLMFKRALLISPGNESSLEGMKLVK